MRFMIEDLNELSRIRESRAFSWSLEADTCLPVGRADRWRLFTENGSRITGYDLWGRSAGNKFPPLLCFTGTWPRCFCFYKELVKCL